MSEETSPAVSVTLELSGQLRDRAKRSSIEIKTPAQSTPARILQLFCESMPPPVAEFCMTQDETPRSSLIFCLNEEQHDWSDPVTLSEGDRIQLLSAISGG